MLAPFVAQRTHRSLIARMQVSTRRPTDCSNDPFHVIHTAAPGSASNTLKCGPQPRFSWQIRVGLEVLTCGSRGKFRSTFLRRKLTLNPAVLACLADKIDA